MRSSRSLGGVCAKLGAPANWAAPTATRARKPKLRVMAASIAGVRGSTELSAQRYHDCSPVRRFVAKFRDDHLNFHPAPESPQIRIQVRRFQARIDRSIELVHDSVGWTEGEGDEARRRYRGPKLTPFAGIATGSIGHAQHRLDRRSLRGVLRRAIDLGKRIERHHPLDRHFALHEEIEQGGDELLRVAFTLDHAAHHPAKLQERHLERYLRAAAGAAEK